MTNEEILNVARAVAAGECWQVNEAGVVIDEKRWLLGTTVAWRVEFERLDRPAVGFVRLDAKTGEVLATGWRAAAVDNVRQLRPSMARRRLERVAA